jgi:hypothetical protein
VSDTEHTPLVVNNAPADTSDIKLLSYRIGKVEEVIQQVSNKFDLFTSKFATREYVDSKLADHLEDITKLDTRLQKQENKSSVKNTLVWVGLVASVLINLFVLYNLFSK